MKMKKGDFLLKCSKTFKVLHHQKADESLHPKLESTVEREEGDCIPFLDKKIIHNGEKLTL